ncbi:MAG: response regulator [Selenomonadaceae bacterium]|nr:response regulator [Selenomonadaceae bacterium]
MKQHLKQFLIRAIIEFAFFAAIVTICGNVVYNKVDNLLIESLKESVAQQSQSTAYTLGERFQHKLDELQTRADLLQQHAVPLDSVMDIATFGTKEGRTRGILRRDNSAITGSPLPERALPSVQEAFDGSQIIDYLRGIGLLFAVPLNLDGEPCVFYELFNDEAVKLFYHTISYNGRGTLSLGTSETNWVLLADGRYPEVATHEYPLPGYLGLDTTKISTFNKAWLELEAAPKDANLTQTLYAENEVDAFFFHRTWISEKYNLVLSGYVEWDDVVVGIDYIYTMMKLIYFIILALIFLSVCFNMRTRQANYLEHEKAIADSANQAKTNFLANMSHEIRTPINTIMGMDEMILRESKEPATLEYARNVNQAAKSLLGIINDVLDLSKIEAGKMEIIPVEYHLNSLLNDLVNMIQKRAMDKNLAFHVETNRNIPSVLFGDEIRIRQVIMNLLTNAVKYTKRGYIVLNVNYVPVDADNVFLCISVSDTGIGIKEEDLHRLFNAFERIEEKRNRTIEGTGLGMNISRHLLNMMGSDLKVHSVYGAGSNFSFQILQRVVDPDPIGDFEETYKRSLQQDQTYEEAFTAPDASILFVDDTEMNLVVVKGLLKQTRIQVDTALSGRECLDLLKLKKYDIIFLDHMMPEMDGIETLQAIKKMASNPNLDTPVISLTANAISGARETYIAAGFDDYLTKPVNSSLLENLIMKYLPPEKILTSRAVPMEDEPGHGVSLPEWLGQVSELDTYSGVMHCGSSDAYLDVLRVFANAIASTSKEIEGYFQAEDWKNYTTKVHALKSTAKIVGASELSSRAKHLEDAGNAGNIDKIRQDHQTLMDLYLSYKEKLKYLIESKDPEKDANKPMIGEEELAEAYASMKEVAASFDYDSLMFVLQSLQEYRLPEKDAEQCRKIKEATDKLDWIQVNEYLKDTH